MLTHVQFLTFLLAAVLITASPGPDNLLVLGMGMSKGRRKGMAFGLGCALGCLSHTLLALVGVSALIASSPLALSALKWMGGVYLAWLGVQALRSSGLTGVDKVSVPDLPLRTLFFRGMLANAVNPKVVLFFLSFLPQFVVPSQGDVRLQLALLGLTFTVQAATLFGLLGFFAGAIGQWLNRRPRAGLMLDRIAGVIFIGLGLRMVVAA